MSCVLSVGECELVMDLRSYGEHASEHDDLRAKATKHHEFLFCKTCAEEDTKGRMAMKA